MTTLQQVIKQRRDEFMRLKVRKERVEARLCATCGRPENHDEITEFGMFTHQWDDGLDAIIFTEESHNQETIETILKAVMKEIGEDIELKHEECISGQKEMCEICLGKTITNDERNRLRQIILSTLQDIKNNKLQ